MHPRFIEGGGSANIITHKDFLGSPERKPHISYTFFLTYHGFKPDIENLSSLLATADIYIPECFGWDSQTVKAFQAVSNGRLKPYEALPLVVSEDSPAYFVRQREFELLHNTQKPIAVVDVHYRSKIVRGEFMSRVVMRHINDVLDGSQPMDEETFNGLLKQVSFYCKLEGRALKPRDMYMIDHLPAAINRILSRHPELQTKGNINVLLFLGAGHEPVPDILESQGYDVIKIFSTDNPTVSYYTEGINIHYLGEDRNMTAELATKILAGFLIDKQLEYVAYESHGDSSRVDQAQRLLVDALTLDEIRSIFMDNPYGQTYLERIQELLDAKGLFIPGSNQAANVLLDQAAHPEKRVQKIRLRKGAVSEPFDYTKKPVKILLSREVVLEIGLPDDLKLPGFDQDCIIFDRSLLAKPQNQAGFRELHDGDDVLLGRDYPENFAFDGSVSRVHIKVSRRGANIVLTDMDSTNGSIVYY